VSTNDSLKRARKGLEDSIRRAVNAAATADASAQHHSNVVVARNVGASGSSETASSEQVIDIVQSDGHTVTTREEHE